MVNQITLTGMILTAAPIGEYDRRVVILTRERSRHSHAVQEDRTAH